MPFKETIDYYLFTPLNNQSMPEVILKEEVFLDEEKQKYGWVVFMWVCESHSKNSQSHLVRMQIQPYLFLTVLVGFVIDLIFSLAGFASKLCPILLHLWDPHISVCFVFFLVCAFYVQMNTHLI